MKFVSEVAPQEACGFILDNGLFVPCENKITEQGSAFEDNPELPNVSFIIDSATYLKYARQISMIVHSHTKSIDLLHDGPSITDQRHQIVSGVPWEIYVVSPNGQPVESYIFDWNVKTHDTDSKYRPGIQDEVSVLEHFLEFDYGHRDRSDCEKSTWMRTVSDTLVLKHRMKSIDQGRWQPKDIGFFGRDMIHGETVAAIYIDSDFHWHDNFGGHKWAKKPPFPTLYRRLRQQ